MSGIVVAETIRRHLTSVWYLMDLALLSIVAMGIAAMQGNRAWPGLVVLLAIVAGAGVIGPEFSSGTLQLILVKPVNRAVYLVSRVAGVLAIVWIAAVIAAIFEVLGTLIGRSPDYRQLGVAVLNTGGDTLLIVALLALFGSFTRAYFNVVLYFGMQFLLVLLLGVGQRRFPADVIRAINWIQSNVFPDAPPRFDRDWLLLVACNAALALVLACLCFRNREVPYGAD